MEKKRKKINYSISSTSVIMSPIWVSKTNEVTFFFFSGGTTVAFIP
jgi:hypothetical protein